MQKGVGYLGSPDIMITSKEWEEILPAPPSNFTRKYNFYKFSISISKPTKIKINNGSEIYLESGFDMSEIDAPITSFKIKDVGVSYNFIAAY